MIKILDLYFLDHSDTIASFLIESTDGLILVETGPYSTFDRMQEALKEHGATVSDVRHVLLTHIHLDHAGSAWAFAKAGAKVYVHPLGYKHLASPEKLWASAKRIYQDQMTYLWGKMEPIAPTQLVAMEDQQELIIGDKRFLAHYTPGHAVHHIAWQLGDVIFSGDVGGVKIGQNLVVPPCPPPDIHLEDWAESIDKILRLKPNSLYLTHYGQIHQVESHLAELSMRLHKWYDWIKPYCLNGTDPKEVVPLFQAFSIEEMKELGVSPDDIERYLKANPPWMSVWGLMRYCRKKGKG